LTRDSNTIVGHADETEAVRTFTDSLGDGPAALVLTGEPGIGKSTIWREGLRAARERGFEVLQCHPVESEAQLAFTALSDLLADLSPDTFGVLPDPQRQALEVALLRAEPDGNELLPRAVALAVLGLLRARSTARPIVVGIDDAHWLDEPSHRVLAFVLRRLRDERVGFLITSRLGHAVSIVDDVDPEGSVRVTATRVSPLGPDQLDAMIEHRFGAVLPPRSLRRLHEMSRGNPMFALHIGGALIERGSANADGELPIPDTLLHLVADRLLGLGQALEAVQVAAVLSRPSLSGITAILGPRAHADVRAAEAADVLTVDGDRVEFAHPLLASAAYAQLEHADRRALHARVAATLNDVEERARHLALAAEGPDADVAEALDGAAARARARGAPDPAAPHWEAAARLTPDDQPEARRERRLAAARCVFELGGVERARTQLEDILADAPTGSTRSRALVLHAWTIAHIDGFDASARAFRSALDELEPDSPFEIDVCQGLAWSLHQSSVALAEPHAQRALALAELSGDEQQIAVSTTLVAFLRSLGGSGLAVDEAGQAVGLARSGRERPQITSRPEWLHGMLLQWEDRLPEARQRYEAMRDEAIARGDEQSLPFVLFHLARTELLLGDWTRAATSAEACGRTTIDSGQQSERPYAAAISGLVRAHFGDVALARADIAEGLELAERFGERPATIEMLATRGFIDISVGRYEEADRTLSDVAKIAADSGLLEPGLFRYHGDAIEAKIALGQLDEAADLLARADEHALRLDRPWLRLIVGRGRGMLEAAQGHLDVACEMLGAALDNDRARQPFERARTQLALGSANRRNRQKRAARDAITTAAAEFDRLGARLWVERARSELARVGGRTPATEALTATERQVAELIAAGRTYREAAAELFISPKTVQWNLSKVYSKLGIRSRAELPGRLLED
jgi:DNA-binding CsgD family transcriptional regulator